MIVQKSENVIFQNTSERFFADISKTVKVNKLKNDDKLEKLCNTVLFFWFVAKQFLNSPENFSISTNRVWLSLFWMKKVVYPRMRVTFEMRPDRITIENKTFRLNFERAAR